MQSSSAVAWGMLGGAGGPMAPGGCGTRKGGGAKSSRFQLTKKIQIGIGKVTHKNTVESRTF